MKKAIVLSLFIIITLFTITGCESTEKSSNNSVVLYFSATGTTKGIAERIANQSNSDIIEIIPKDKYESKDLDYGNDCRATKEQQDKNARPEIENTIDISAYDTIYLGYPIWWGDSPKIILTLLDTYDFTGKTIIPFCTSGSSGIIGSVNKLREYKPELNIKDGMRFAAGDSDKIIKDFINNN